MYDNHDVVIPLCRTIVTLGYDIIFPKYKRQDPQKKRWIRRKKKLLNCHLIVETVVLDAKVFNNKQLPLLCRIANISLPSVPES